MSAAFEIRFQESFYDFFSLIYRNKTGRDAYNISIVVLACQLCEFFVPANSGTNVLVFIGGYGYTVGTSANQDAIVRFAAFNSGEFGLARNFPLSII